MLQFSAMALTAIVVFSLMVFNNADDFPTRLPTNPHPTRLPTLTPTLQFGKCRGAINWILTKNTDTVNGISCDSVCSNQLPTTECAGDYPLYSGWPFTPDELSAIVTKLDKSKFPNLSNCDLESFSVVDDDHVPEFYYVDGSAQLECSPFFLMSKTPSNGKTGYRCSDNNRMTSNMLCPCCPVFPSPQVNTFINSISYLVIVIHNQYKSNDTLFII